MNEAPRAGPMRRGTLTALGFTVAYLLGATFVALGRGNQEFIFYIVVMVLLLLAAMAVHVRVNLSSGLLWALSVWGLAHMAGGLLPVPESWPINGEIRVLYSWWLIPGLLKYDHVVHAFGFGVTTWVCWEGLRSILAERQTSGLRPTLGMLTLCCAAGMGFGAANEIVEFAATLLVPETNVGGYENTGWDLVSNMVGAVTAGCLIRLTHRLHAQQ